MPNDPAKMPKTTPMDAQLAEQLLDSRSTFLRQLRAQIAESKDNCAAFGRRELAYRYPTSSEVDAAWEKFLAKFGDSICAAYQRGKANNGGFGIDAWFICVYFGLRLHRECNFCFPLAAVAWVLNSELLTLKQGAPLSAAKPLSEFELNGIVDLCRDESKFTPENDLWKRAGDMYRLFCSRR